MEENDKKIGQEDPEPLTDEEFEELKRKEKRTGRIISAILDFFRAFSHDAGILFVSAARVFQPRRPFSVRRRSDAARTAWLGLIGPDE